MITEMYSIFDVKAMTFGRPVFVPALPVLLRELQDALKGEDMLARHPEDFRLFRLGTFDDTAGVVVVEALPQFVLDVSSLLAPVAPVVPLTAVA